jgi:hypothetical protein
VINIVQNYSFVEYDDMQTFTASQAKYNKTVAIVMLPDAVPVLPNPRLQARIEQQQREQQRLMRHQQLAIALLCATPAQQARQLKTAHAEVARGAARSALGTGWPAGQPHQPAYAALACAQHHVFGCH